MTLSTLNTMAAPLLFLLAVAAFAGMVLSLRRLLCWHKPPYIYEDRIGKWTCRCGEHLKHLKPVSSPGRCTHGHPLEPDGTCTRCESYAWDAVQERAEH